MHAVIAGADALDMPEIVLLGDPVFYRRFGFRHAEAMGVIAPDPHWAKHFQIRTLTAWTEQRRGPFRYAPAFGGIRRRLGRKLDKFGAFDAHDLA